ncbi:DUF4148 domain-containing protein [Trinickia terrae]|uniref:DUF4148 domain-containing protein n=1 Tax=Trinickia terrae TaxID=2571161 RepID=A0A4U1HFW6_9BURK|nr:DUF4148 domain-containing protein [Trinickia terrae]TKC79892.1 DUF4148 domain-containing protein [Trinickia terrae]
MKTLILIPVATLSLCATQVYAGDDTGTSGTPPDSGAAIAAQSVGGSLGGTSGSGAPVGKTRAEVYQELQRAQKDGTLDRLNALYGGGN